MGYLNPGAKYTVLLADSRGSDPNYTAHSARHPIKWDAIDDANLVVSRLRRKPNPKIHRVVVLSDDGYIVYSRDV